ncbi:unnamed protein product [Acanthosepion pharaonis]|uniref:Uncharacterized protein n=1 Tax=Acanthosepion pharaonis TaxID=158019 RepID=A0A812B045_ACAPH|nr:unnamed protein product [Sepia pharaonis]
MKHRKILVDDLDDHFFTDETSQDSLDGRPLFPQSKRGKILVDNLFSQKETDKILVDDLFSSQDSCGDHYFEMSQDSCRRPTSFSQDEMWTIFVDDISFLQTKHHKILVDNLFFHRRNSTRFLWTTTFFTDEMSQDSCGRPLFSRTKQHKILVDELFFHRRNINRFLWATSFFTDETCHQKRHLFFQKTCGGPLFTDEKRFLWRTSFFHRRNIKNDEFFLWVTSFFSRR